MNINVDTKYSIGDIVKVRIYECSKECKYGRISDIEINYGETCPGSKYVTFGMMRYRIDKKYYFEEDIICKYTLSP